MWYKLVQLSEWFGEMSERTKLVRDFNKAAREAFISANAGTLLEAKVTWGDSSNKHAFSKFLGGGFRIKAMSGNYMAKYELIEVGKVILDNEMLVRKLISLGWDTLEVHDNYDTNGCTWALKDYANFGGYLTETIL